MSIASGMEEKMKILVLDDDRMIREAIKTSLSERYSLLFASTFDEAVKILNDSELDGILKVIKFKAIMTDFETGIQTPLWPERYTLEMLDRQKRKVGQDAWDRNYMQNPGSSSTNRTFTDEMIDQCLNPLISSDH